MKHNLNLLSAELLPPPQSLNARTLLLSWALVTAALALALGFGYWQKSQVLGQKQQLQAQLKQKQKQLTAKETALKGHVADKALLAQRDLLALDRDNAKALLTRVDELNQLPQDGFSPVLQALAESTVNGLWLNDIRIEGQQLSLTGHAFKAPLVMQWLQGFASQPALAGRQFGRLAMDQQKDGNMAFSLASGAAHEAH
ncbi:PilN domain-containing protein [Gallaecimonas mangrovi]|uniref:PilN domain-containing protein n=1 Tax=Gallaecimonas mangrovi TaxID=2291597 RepID=UPI000E1FCDB2|nr:PilN domain-containing protein [Gallaecimonas mangrovi]